MSVVDSDDGSMYNSEVYTRIAIEYERLPSTEGMDEGEAAATRQAALHAFLDLPGTHLAGYSQTVDRRQVGAPEGFSAFWAGMDVGVTNHPSEILVCGQARCRRRRARTCLLDQLLAQSRADASSRPPW